MCFHYMNKIFSMVKCYFFFVAVVRDIILKIGYWEFKFNIRFCYDNFPCN